MIADGTLKRESIWLKNATYLPAIYFFGEKFLNIHGHSILSNNLDFQAYW